jgi:hypothetical protein
MSSAKRRRKTNPSAPADFAVVMLNECEASALRFAVSLDQDRGKVDSSSLGSSE